MKKFLQDFRDFAMRGNVIDLAVAVVIAGAFGAIIKSLVDDIIMPIVGVLLGGVDFSSLAISYGTAVIAYGKFIQAIVNFVIIAFALFIFIRAATRMQKAKEETPPPPPSDEVVLLGEIRDLLKK